MFRHYSFLVLIPALALSVSLAPAEEKEPAKETKIDKATARKHAERLHGVHNLYAAHSLILYAKREKSPLALVVAADMLAQANAKQGKLMEEKGKTAHKHNIETPATLLKEAREMAKKTDAKTEAAIETLAASVEKSLATPRGRSPFPISGSTTLNGAGIYEAQFVNGAPGKAYCIPEDPNAVVSIRVSVVNADGTPGPLVATATGSSPSVEWMVPGISGTTNYKIMILPVSPPPFKTRWGTN